MHSRRHVDNAISVAVLVAPVLVYWTSGHCVSTCNCRAWQFPVSNNVKDKVRGGLTSRLNLNRWISNLPSVEVSVEAVFVAVFAFAVCVPEVAGEVLDGRNDLGRDSRAWKSSCERVRRYNSAPRLCVGRGLRHCRR